MLAARSLLFYVGYVGVTVVWATLSVAVAWAMPLAMRYHFIIGCWTRMVLWWLRLTCGIRAEVRGLGHIPAEPCIFFVKHQSTWETLWVQTLRGPQSTLIKRELLRIPFWGWAFSLVRPIAIDRSNPRLALRQFIDQGRDRLRRGMSISLFPEGTRLLPGKKVGRFYRGGAALAAATGTPVLVIAHNAGSHWPRGFLKTPGVIRVEISEPFETQNRKSSEINEACEAWLRDAMTRLEG